MFTPAISCLTTSYLPGFRVLTFQVLMQYYSLQHQILLPPLDTSTIGCCFCFGSASSFLLELFLHSFLVAHWSPTNLGVSSFSMIYFCLFILFMGCQGRNVEVAHHSFSIIRSLHHDLSILGGPAWHD